MSLPYENSTSGKNAINEMQKILQSFGASSFGVMEDFDNGEVIAQFKHRGQHVSVRASSKGYAAAWLKHNKYTTRMRSTRQQHEEKALKIGQTAVYSILRDWIKGQITAVECGILSFEGAFLGQILLPSGKTILEKVTESKILTIEDNSDEHN